MVRPKRRKRTKKERATKWTDEYYVTCYQLARDGCSNGEIFEALGVSHVGFRTWRKEYPALQDALDRGREDDGGTLNLHEYIYKKLSPALQDIWDEITAWEDAPNGIQMIEEILSSQGKRPRQSLFIHAILVCNFNVAKACRKVLVPRQTFDHWVATDPDFHALMREMIECKKDFYEDAMVKLVRQGNPQAVIHANKTYNRDRGYGDKLDVNFTGQLDHNHTHHVVGIDQLNLPVEVQKEILTALREYKEEHGIVDDPIDVDYVVRRSAKNGNRPKAITQAET